MENTQNNNESPDTATSSPITFASPPPTMGRVVRFIESGQEHAATVCYVNEDETVNLLVLGHEGHTFTRTNVRRAAIECPTDKKERAACEQRWFWPPRA